MNAMSAAYNITQPEQGRLICIREANSEQIDSWYQRNAQQDKNFLKKISPKLVKVIVILLLLFSLYLPQSIFALTSPQQEGQPQLISPIPQTEVLNSK